MLEEKPRELSFLGKHLSVCFALVIATIPITLPLWGWQFWYLRPFIMYASILPYFFAPLAFLNAVPCQVCALLGILEESKATIIHYSVKFLWTPYMRIMHGYEVEGLENVPPPDKGGLIAFYHGACALDAAFISAEIFRYQGRIPGGTVHRGILKIPLIGSAMRTYGFTADGRDQMIEDLKKGALKVVAPGGDYELMFSENYSVEFGRRCGFAVAAKAAGVPIIPMFTENIREFQRCHFFGCKALVRFIYEKYGVPCVWPFGGFPVKLRTHLGKPIYCGENETAREFADRTKKAIEDLRDAHQKLDNSILRAVIDRFG